MDKQLISKEQIVLLIFLLTGTIDGRLLLSGLPLFVLPFKKNQYVKFVIFTVSLLQ